MKGVDFQLLFPHVYCRNLATAAIERPREREKRKRDRAFQTSKDRGITTIYGTNPNVNIILRDTLLQLALMTLNLIYISHWNPCLSAYSQLHGSFDFSNQPLASPGTSVLVHEKNRDKGDLGTSHSRCVVPWPSNTSFQILSSIGVGTPRIQTMLFSTNSPPYLLM